MERFWPQFGLALALCWALGVSGDDPRPGFYVWQRHWDQRTLQATGGDRELFPLAVEFSQAGAVRSDAPPELLARSTPVFRVHAGLLGKLAPKRLAAEIKRANPARAQLDIDCPESRLEEYGRFLDALTPLLPKTELSITVLPCQLKHPEFRALAGRVAYYVLQLHGLEVPSNRRDDCQLMRRDVALDALRTARSLGLPFRVALPTYAKQLLFKRDGGAFAGLDQDNHVDLPPAYEARLAKPDLQLLHELLELSPLVIWFRLPIPGERLNLDLATIEQLEAGTVPAPKIETFVRPRPRGADLLAKTSALLDNGRFEIRLAWKKPLGEFELFNGAVDISERREFGVLPTALSAPAPGCGETTLFGSFHSGETPTITTGASK